MTYDITIYVDNIERNFRVDEDQIINNDWNAVIADMKDTMDARHDPDEPSFQERVEQAGV